MHICIGIQARSTSTRMPGKISQLIGHKTVLEHVVDSSRKAAAYISNYSHVPCSVFVLVPKEDPIIYLTQFAHLLIEGSEDDVLSRYVQMAEMHDASHIVRITADCPLLPPWIISKCINAMIKNNLDYVSNVGDIDNSMRTTIDGEDIESMSMAALTWADTVSVTKESREHVTTALRGEKIPRHLRRGVLIGHKDFSHIKLSLDTPEDLAKIREDYDSVQSKILKAKSRHYTVFRF